MSVLLMVEEAAARLNTSPRFVRRLVSERRIAFTRLGRHVRIGESDVAAYGPAGRVEPLRPGLLRAAPQTFPTKGEADRWLALAEVELRQGRWLDPARGEVPLGEYAQRWVVERPGLRPRTVELYEGLLRRHLLPQLGRFSFGGSGVRAGRAGAGPAARAGAAGHVRHSAVGGADGAAPAGP